MTNYNYMQMVNGVIENLNGIYGYSFPIVHNNDFKAFSAALITSPKIVKNAFMEGMYNLIINLTIKEVYKATNPFRKLYREDTTVSGEGSQYVEEIALDQFIPVAYEMNGNPEKFFKSHPPKVKAQILCNVLRKKYEFSFNKYISAPSFEDYASIDAFVRKAMERLMADMEEDDKEEIIAALDAVVEGGNMRIMPAVRPTDSASALAFCKQLDIISRDLAFKRHRDYNLQHISTKTAEGDAVIIVAGDVLSTQNTYNLAWAFNRSFIDLSNKGQIIAVDSDGLAGNRVFAIYTDTDFFRIHNIADFPRIEDWHDGYNLEDHRWVHNWKMINFSYASNAVAFVDPDDIGVTSVVLKDKDGNSASSVKKGKYITLDLPEVTAATGKLADCFVNYTISGAVSPDTVIAQDGTLYVAPDETAETITITGTSHLDNTKSGTYTVTVID